MFLLVFSVKLPPPVLSLTLRSALLWGAKAPVVANIAYYAMSLLANRESFYFRFISLSMPVLGLQWVIDDVQRDKL